GPDGNVIDRPVDSAGQSVLWPNHANMITSILEDVITSGTGAADAIGRPAAGKTGTAQDYTNAWFCGYIPQLAACVWVGYPRGNISMRNVGGFSAVYGGSIPALIWHRFMSAATTGMPVKTFQPPSLVEFPTPTPSPTRTPTPAPTPTPSQSPSSSPSPAPWSSRPSRASSSSPVASPAVSFTLPLALSQVPLARSSVPLPIAVSSLTGLPLPYPAGRGFEHGNLPPADPGNLNPSPDVPSLGSDPRSSRRQPADAKHRREGRCEASARRGPRRDRRILAGRDLPKEPRGPDRVLECGC